VNEVELMFRTKCQAGFTLYPGKAYLEIKGKLFNRSLLPQTFLWWANPAVKVNEHYQSVFPPDVHAVFDHGKRDVSEFPIARGKYYKVDYAPGTDISLYKNIPVPTSYMAIQSKFDFVGGYEHDTQSGILHVADHHVSTGKKQWTWGDGDFGHSWNRNLTDEDGPYIELMTGVYTDNQPDFSWLQPNEEKTFEQFFMPYYKVGMVKNATKDAMVNLEMKGNAVSVIVYATAEFFQSSIHILNSRNEIVKTFTADLSPLEVFETSFEITCIIGINDLKIEVKGADGKLLVAYASLKAEHQEIPPAATAAKAPVEIESIDALFLNGLHIEQYRHATYQATDYYAEALRRDPNDSRCNNAMGLWLLRNGRFEKAEGYFRKAIKTITSRNPNPYDGEAYYNLGIILQFQGKMNDAYDAFFKATWNDDWQHNGFLQLARIDASKTNFEEALVLVEKSLVKNYHSHSARHLKTIILRKLKNYKEAINCIESSLEIDPFNFGCGFEYYFLLQENGDTIAAGDQLKKLQLLMRNAVNNYLYYAFYYAAAGCFSEAIALLQFYTETPGVVNPMVFYCLSYFAARNDENDLAKNYAQKARESNPDYCFPNKLEEIIVLQYAINANPLDYKAYYYLGNLWFGMRQYPEAIEAFEKSISINPSFATAHRNLALLYYNKQFQPGKALRAMELAFSLDKRDSRVLMELDQLWKRLNYPLIKRLAQLNEYPDLVNQRDDLFLEKITLENNLQYFELTKEMLAGRIFHPWEGGEGKVVGQYLASCMGLAKKAMVEKEYDKALELLEAAGQYPVNLGEGKLYGSPENDIHYLQGCVYEAMGLNEQATGKFKLATEGDSEPVQAIFYNDPQPDKIFYQGLAWQKLGHTQKAENIFKRLIEFSDQHYSDHVTIDYFAVSLPDLLVFDTDLNEKNQVHCRYIKGLGELGLQHFETAANLFNDVLFQDCSHTGAIIHLNMIGFLTNLGEEVTAI
jgi:tetratricopeptide (TPR) repeat protein